ncbi:MAG: BON domain-containing protein [Deltaproteobacteria bacterium]|nr:BON domain-containing protein [Deltaproteobacteria bacterium]
MHVDDSLIEVSVQNGAVTLTGTVGSLPEKEKAGAEAWIAGVSEVINNLAVEAWARQERFRSGKYRKMSDAEIVEGIKDAIRYDPWINLFNITVEAEDGMLRFEAWCRP